MVLEASSMSDAYDATPDTPDPYENTTPTISPESLISEIQNSRLPRPAPVVGALFGFTPSYTSTLVASRLEFLQSLLGRNATFQERQAMLFHESKGVMYMSYGIPAVCGIGLYRAYQTRETYRWPFYGSLKSETGWFDGERIRIMGRTIFEGDAARRIMHLHRASGYLSLAYFFGGLTVMSFATTVTGVGQLQDPRLKDFQQAIKTNAKVRMGETDAMKQPKNQTAKDPTGQGNTSMTDLWTRHRKGIGAKDTGVVDDDASPSAGTEGFFGGDAERLAGSNVGIMSDAQMRTQEVRQQVSPERSPTENRATTFQLDKVAKQPDSFDGSMDDASPTAQASASENQGGSTWDRIRQNAQADTPGIGRRAHRWDALQKEQQQGSTTGDSFTFSSTDEDRQLAKNEAQDEFDARVEKERQGGNFNENGRKRW
ncbi:MAG: hypothetical protein Q9218_003029 [Villophora microphyllina]